MYTIDRKAVEDFLLTQSSAALDAAVKRGEISEVEAQRIQRAYGTSTVLKQVVDAEATRLDAYFNKRMH